jgi:hypothetical protein
MTREGYTDCRNLPTLLPSVLRATPKLQLELFDYANQVYLYDALRKITELSYVYTKALVADA